MTSIAAYSRSARCSTALAALILLTVPGCQERVREAPSVSVPTLDGRTVALQDGTAVRYVNFWSTDCAICLRDMPGLAALHERRATDDFEIVAVALSTDRPSDVLEWSESQSLPFTVAFDPGDRAIDGFGDVHGTPTGFLVDRDGMVVARYVGELDIESLERDLDRALSVPKAAS